jgi:hypothetical protein
MNTYTGWWEVPDHLMPATALGELEYPRAPGGCQPVAWVECRGWSDRKTSIPLYDARTCPPTKATARQLEVAAARSGRRRSCAECGAHCQRPLTVDPHDRRPMCPACRHLARLRHRQAQLAAARPHIAERARELLAWPDAIAVQVDLHTPPPTPAGRRRPPTAARVRAARLDGARLLDVLVRLVGPRAHHVPHGAVAQQAAAPEVHLALVGRRQLMWSVGDLERLRQAAAVTDDTLPRCWHVDELSQPHLPIPEHVRAAAVNQVATRWRGQLDPHTLVACLVPGTPDRLLLMLRRIGATPRVAKDQSDGQTGRATVDVPAASDPAGRS